MNILTLKKDIPWRLNQNTKAVVEENLINAFCKMPAILSKLPVAPFTNVV